MNCVERKGCSFPSLLVESSRRRPRDRLPIQSDSALLYRGGKALRRATLASGKNRQNLKPAPSRGIREPIGAIAR